MIVPVKDIDVTNMVDFHDNDGESLPLVQCVCGERFAEWDCILSIYRDMAKKCSKCGRKLYFRNEIRVYEVKDELPS